MSHWAVAADWKPCEKAMGSQPFQGEGTPWSQPQIEGNTLQSCKVCETWLLAIFAIFHTRQTFKSISTGKQVRKINCNICHMYWNGARRTVAWNNSSIPNIFVTYVRINSHNILQHTLPHLASRPGWEPHSEGDVRRAGSSPETLMRATQSGWSFICLQSWLTSGSLSCELPCRTPKRLFSQCTEATRNDQRSRIKENWLMSFCFFLIS